MAGGPRAHMPFASTLPTRSEWMRVSHAAGAGSSTLARHDRIMLLLPRSRSTAPRRSAFPARNARETDSRWPGRTVQVCLRHGRGRRRSAQQQGEGGTGCLVLRHVSRRDAECTHLSVHVVAREPGGREGTTVTDYEHASLSRQARGALSEHWLAGGPAGAWRRSFGGCNTCGLELLLDAFESRIDP